jgi:hypothetical protein
MEVVAGREAKRTMRERASSRSRNESVKVGYLRQGEDQLPPSFLDPPKPDAPLLDDMINPVDRLGFVQVLRESPFASSNRPRQLLRKRLVLPQLAQHRLVEKVLYILGVIERGWSRGPLVGLFARTGLARIDACKPRARE